jgi:hypothetical protein
VVKRWGQRLLVHGAFLVGTDPTLTAKRMLGIQMWKDCSDNADRGTSLVYHHWNLVGLFSR